jgi:aminopeptidase N
VEEFINRQSGKNFCKVFDQYLRTANIPVLEYRQNGNTVQYRWNNTITGFDMPVRLTSKKWLTPKAAWQTLKLQTGESFGPDKNFYVNVRKL